MPCRCTGVKLNKCKCVLDAAYPLKRNGSNVVLVTRNKSDCLQRTLAKRSTLFRVIESIYEKCAEYNLRYCQLRGFIKPANTFKDLLVLACFMIANLVVFLTIFFKTLIHMYFGIKHTACWLRRTLDSKMSAETQPLLSTHRHDYSPPGDRMFN